VNLDELVSEYWPPSMFCDRSISGLPDPRGRKGANKRADRPSPCSSPRTVASKRALSRLDDKPAVGAYDVRETLINGPTSEVAGEMASNFLDDEANRRSIQ
jgi:hypothetical protein